jgi:hypothetical protein
MPAIAPHTDSALNPDPATGDPAPAAIDDAPPYPGLGHDSLRGAAPVPRLPRPGRVRLPRGLRSETGAATAEYAVATMAAVGFAGLLIVILRGDEVRGILTELVRSALSVG